eukprot:CAMPEP_0195529390 /NCGR_PEP_ID=MMETSP0794_2-20130614/31907_1 /TAXON_ID=515487 /ORGANISM="Stephanopyxis turris, Strain CCMP 815" /LENGTH=177 /DNA_ID=CAMNT_0040660687 /DNA_START=14 /DNA_END=547 /DNA_ORIENTATION=+
MNSPDMANQRKTIPIERALPLRHPPLPSRPRTAPKPSPIVTSGKSVGRSRRSPSPQSKSRQRTLSPSLSQRRLDKSTPDNQSQCSSHKKSSSHPQNLDLSYNSNNDDDVSCLSEGFNSHSQSVMSEALKTILNQMELAKAQLMDPANQNDITTQIEMAGLIEKLSSAAIAVKKLEEL